MPSRSVHNSYPGCVCVCVCWIDLVFGYRLKNDRKCYRLPTMSIYSSVYAFFNCPLFRCTSDTAYSDVSVMISMYSVHYVHLTLYSNAHCIMCIVYIYYTRHNYYKVYNVHYIVIISLIMQFHIFSSALHMFVYAPYSVVTYPEHCTMYSV